MKLQIKYLKSIIIGNFDYHIDGVDNEIIQRDKISEIEDLTKNAFDNNLNLLLLENEILNKEILILLGSIDC